METVSMLHAFCAGNPPVTGGFPSQPSDAGFDVFFDVSLNTRLNKRSSRQWFELPGIIVMKWYQNEFQEAWLNGRVPS